MRKAYKQDLAAAWSLARRKRANDTPYAFVLYGVEGGEPPRFTPCVLTEESLTRVAQRYLDEGYHDTLEEARKALRYSVADSPLLEDLDACMPTVDALVAPYAKVLDDDTGYALLAKAAIAALTELDAELLFGTGTERERLLLVIITEDTPKDWSKVSARKLNPPSVFNRFENETKVEGEYMSSDTIAITPDGSSIYSGGTGNSRNTKAKDSSIAEVVRYDIIGCKLVRQWVYDFPLFGDSIHSVAQFPNGQSILALRCKYEKGCQSILLRFECNSNKPVAEHRFPGEPTGLAISFDGSVIAVSLRTGALHLFDGDFRPIGVRALKSTIYSPLFLRSGELLVPADSGVLRIDPARDQHASVVASLPSFRFASDEGNTILAVSQWFAMSGRNREDPKEFGIHLLRVPSFEPLRTILIPGHQAVTPAISPDGRLLAFEARDIHTPRKFVAVFETATGREIARRKSNFVRALAFLPDNRTLAIARSGFTTTAPIDLWVMPDV